MANSKYFIMLSLFILIGIFLGVIITAYSNLNSDINSVENNSFKSSGNQFENNALSQTEYLNNISTPSGNQLTNNSYTTSQLSTNTTIMSGDTTLDLTNKKLIPQNINAIYLTGWSAGTKSKRASVIENLTKFGFNAVVIDIKDEAGNLSYKSNVQTAIDISASKNMISDIKNVIEEFHNANIYVIGRIVTFKDPTYAKNIPSIAYTASDGSTWKDYSGNNWPNPYNISSWDYPISLAKEAAELGFDEIQFDYIRFPSSEGKTKNIVYGFDSDTKTKSEIINSFLTYAMQELAQYDVVVSADVFGITTKKMGDFEHIGQDFYEIAKIVDVICPMIYPSHYGFGEYGISKPDTKPYEIVKYALLDAQKQYNSTNLNSENLTNISGDVTTNVTTNITTNITTNNTDNDNIKLATIRPYLQDFTASWLKKGNYILYDTDAVTAQIQACYDLGIKDFILWDPSNKYAYEAMNNIKDKNTANF